jgi:hypothetical protein
MQRATSEPAARLLPEGENWRPETWRHFRFAVLRQLRNHGAQSVDEIAAAPPSVLFLRLNRTEVRAILDSARRLGLITPLDVMASAEAFARQTEWAVTARGNRAIRYGLPWVLGRLDPNTVLKAAVTFVIGLLSAGAAVQWLTSLDVTEVAVGIEIAVLLLWILISVVLAVRSRTAGAEARRATSEDWQRWRRECILLREIADLEFPRVPTLVALPAFVLLEVVLYLLGAEQIFWQAIPWIALLVFTYPAMIWFLRWYRIEELAVKAELGEH